MNESVMIGGGWQSGRADDRGSGKAKLSIVRRVRPSMDVGLGMGLSRRTFNGEGLLRGSFHRR